jgi:excinuclease Cho
VGIVIQGFTVNFIDLNPARHGPTHPCPTSTATGALLRPGKPEFDGPRAYEYPQHLRPSLDAMPQAPGVYTFHGQEGDLPLYIGKSVALRNRILSHLRNPDEARMLRQTTRITFIRTAGEIGALLLEAQMIKQQHPLFNQKLRRNRQLCSWRVSPTGAPEVVYSKDMDFAVAPDLYGLYGSRTSALQSLRDLADEHRLCYGALGLEKAVPNRGCFRSMLKQCAGVCCGREAPEEHHRRLFSALEGLRVNCWPYPGAVGLVERWEDESAPMTQIHVVRNWCYLGSVEQIEHAPALTQVAAGFDADGYKILCQPILNQAVQVVVL